MTSLHPHLPELRPSQSLMPTYLAMTMKLQWRYVEYYCTTVTNYIVSNSSLNVSRENEQNLYMVRRQVTRTKSKSGVVVKYQRMLVDIRDYFRGARGGAFAPPLSNRHSLCLIWGCPPPLNFGTRRLPLFERNPEINTGYKTTF